MDVFRATVGNSKQSLLSRPWARVEITNMMISKQATASRVLAVAAAFCAAAMVVPVVGCGGGSSSGPSNSNVTPVGNVTVNGRIVDGGSSNAAVAGAQVFLGNQQFTTGADGRFSFVLQNPTSNPLLRVLGPTGQGFQDTGTFNGRNISLGATGVTIDVAGGGTIDLGDIQIYGPNYPPLPPVFPE